MRRKATLLIIFTMLIIGLPLVGVYLAGKSVAPYLNFPPMTVAAVPLPFSWPVFFLYLLVAGLVLGVLFLGAKRQVPDKGTVAEMRKKRLPWWGWAALAVTVSFWIMAWNRFSWFAPLQGHTFIPLWFSFAVFANSLCFRRSGRCPMLQRPGAYGVLFPLSSVFWWYYEYLNQFVHNWYYVGTAEGPLRYTLLATVSFSTVLPAVVAVRQWLMTFAWFRCRFYGLQPMPFADSKVVAWGLLLLACAGLVGIGWLPDQMSALLWLAPLFLLTSLQKFAGERTILYSLTKGDWRPMISAAAAALFCGFFWEMWNWHSLAKWVYSVPYVYRFKVFEMPILGYLGYLPFGLLCVAVAAVVDDFPGQTRCRQHGA